MNTLAWLLLALLIVGPGVALFVTRPRPTRCACGGFKLPRAARCFDCTDSYFDSPEALEHARSHPKSAAYKRKSR